MKQYVIIGNGVAAAGCIEGIRSADPDGAVTVVSAERHPVYCRPLISYYLEGKTDMERMRYRDAGFYEQNGCRVLYGRSAVRLDAAAKTVELDDGTILPYDSLCVAAGSSPFLPPLEGLETVEKTFTFMTLDDALALEAAVKDDSRVLIVGAGLIGLKCAEGLYNRAASITVCDLAGRVLSSVLDDECAARMQRHLEAHGIRFLLGGITVSLSLFTDRGVQLTLLHGNLALGEFDLLGLSRDLRLLLCDIEFTLLLGRHGLLDHICLGCGLVGSLLQLRLLQIKLVLALGNLLLCPDLGKLRLLLDLSCLVGTHRADNPLRI